MMNNNEDGEYFKVNGDAESDVAEEAFDYTSPNKEEKEKEILSVEK